MLDFQALSSKGEKEGEGEKEEIPSPHHAGSSSNSFIETYPHFLAWLYEVMNPNGTYSSMPLDRPKYTPNIPGPIRCVLEFFSSLSLFLLGLLNSS